MGAQIVIESTGHFTDGSKAKAHLGSTEMCIRDSHYGMFAFNTAEPAEIDDALAKASVAGTRARMQVAYSLSLD